MLLLLLLLKVRILWKSNSLKSLTFFLTRETETQISWAVWQNWYFGLFYHLRIEVLQKLLCFFVSVSLTEEIWENRKKLLFHKIRTWRTGCTWDLVEDFLDKSLAFRNSMDFDFCNFRVFSCSGFKVLSMLLPLKEK